MGKKTVAVFTAFITCFALLPAPLLAQTTVAGTLVFNFNINANNGYGGPTGTPSCTATATVNDTGSGATISESSNALADGPYSNATCTVSIGYKWILASASTDKVVLSYSVSAPLPNPGAPPGSSQTRTSQVQNFITINLPPNGAKTTKTITVTINQ